MHVTFNAKERTLSEITALALSAGWEVDKVTMASGGSGFAYILAKPCECERSFFEDDESVDSTFSHELTAEREGGNSYSVTVETMPTFGLRPPTPFDYTPIERPENPIGRNEEKGAWKTLKKRLSSSFLRQRMVQGEGEGSSGSDSEGEVHYLGKFRLLMVVMLMFLIFW